MHQKIRENKKITVFDDVEEMKWFFHKQLCRDSTAFPASRVVEILDVDEVNEFFKRLNEPYEVKKGES